MGDRAPVWDAAAGAHCSGGAEAAPAAAAAPPPAAAAAAAAAATAAAPPPAAAGAASFIPAIAAALAAKKAAPRTTEEHAHVRVEDKTASNLARAAARAEAKTRIPLDAQTSLDSPVIAKWVRKLDGGLGWLDRSPSAHEKAHLREAVAVPSLAAQARGGWHSR